MTSRPFRRSSPSSRWRTLSSHGHKISPMRKSFEHEQFYDISHRRFGDRLSTVRSPHIPGVSRRNDFQISNASLDNRPSFDSRNLKTVSKSSRNYSQYSPAPDILPRKRYSVALRNFGGNSHEHRGMKRLRSHEELSDSLPVKWSRHQLEQRYGTRRPYSRSPPQNDSGDRWHSSPSFRKSEERLRSVSHDDEYGEMQPLRNSVADVRKTSDSFKGRGPERYSRSSNLHGGREQSSGSWRHQFSGDAVDKCYDALDKSSSKNDVPSGPQRLRKESSLSSATVREDQKSSGLLNRDKEKIMKDIQRSPFLYKQNSKEKMSPGKRDQYLHDRKRIQSINRIRKQESLAGARTGRRKGGIDEHMLQSRHSKDSTKETKCSNVKSSNESDLSHVAQSQRSDSRSLSPDSIDSHSSSKFSTSGQSRNSNGSIGSRSSSTDIQVKARVLEFNPEYVVIVRRHDEGERPLCLREEFSEIVRKSTNVEKNSELQDTHSAEKTSAFETASPKPDKEADPCVCESRSTFRDSSVVKFPKENKLVDADIADNTGEKPLSCHESSSSVSEVSDVSAKTEEDEEIVGSDRIISQNNSSGVNQQNTNLTSETAEESSVSKKKITFDLRQRISERRQLRTGKGVNTPRIVQRFPNQSKNLDESFSRVSSQGTSQSQNYSQRQIFNRQSFFRRKAEPRRSVVLRQSQ